MNNYLIVIVGNNYINPLYVTGNLEYIVRNLSNESNSNDYLYCIYSINDKYSCYTPYGVIYHGDISRKEGNRIDGIRIAR